MAEALVHEIDKKAFWREHQEKYEQSGLSQKEYCKRKNLNIHTFSYWRGRLDRTEVNKKPPKSDRLRLVPIGPINDPPKTQPVPIEVRISDCVVIIRAGTDADLLNVVLATIRGS